MKKGFTLIELLAAILILAIIIIIAMPKILNVIESMKIKSIENSATIIIKNAQNNFLVEHSNDNKKDATIVLCKDIIDLNNNYEYCTIKYDNNKNATINLKGAPNSRYENLKCTGSVDNINCTKITPKKCTYDGTLTTGATFVDGQYTYKYRQKATAFDTVWESFTDDGWGVRVTDLESTDPVTTELCTTINNKPILKTNCMFRASQATSIDISSLDSYYVNDAARMFWNSKATEIIGLDNLSTEKVTTMYAMFIDSKAENLDVSTFDTSNVTNMAFMFNKTQDTDLDVSTFDTKNVTNMEGMFSSSIATSIKGLKNFSTSKVTNMRQMFAWTNLQSLDLSSFDTSNVTNMNSMFNGSKSLQELDLRSFDTSKVTDMSRMFYNTTIKKFYLNNFTSTASPNISEFLGANNYFTDVNLESFDFSYIESPQNSIMGHDHTRTAILKDCSQKALVTNNTTTTRLTVYDKNNNLC